MTDEARNTTQEDQPQQQFNPGQPETLISHLEKASGPVDFDTLADALGAEDGQRDALKSTLESLAKKGAVIQTRDGRFGSPAKMNLVAGRLQCHEKGFGFVVPHDRNQEDLYIPRRKLGDALHGDIVVARRESTKGQRAEGRIIRLLQRARSQVVGKFERGKRFGYVTPLDSRIGYEVYIAEGDAGEAQSGQLVTAEITSYPEGKGRRNPEGKIVEVLGDPDDPRLDVEVIIREFGLPHAFPEEVIEEADKIAVEVTVADIQEREDFRDLPIVTIDGENAKDFDDAVYVEKLDNGNYKLQVHIADVSAYVPVGSAIDQEARLRATSVYFPDRVVPMLPERLSNEICSLKPGVDRLVQSVEIEIDRKGHTVNFELYDGVIHSAARMTYKQVAALLEGSDDKLNEQFAGHVEHFKLMSELCDVLRAYRMKRGSIDFDLPEPDMRINMLGEVEDIFRTERNQAHRLIEEFMIRANEVVASHMEWEDLPAPFRVHEGPDPEKVEQFREFIGGLGLHLGGGKNPSPADFQKLVEHLQGQPGERTLIYLMLRTMKQARYQVDNIGHFGLASPRYGHFTSPIRRYPDLILHRLLKADLERTTQKPFDIVAYGSHLHAMCNESSERERNAEEAERRYVDWKTVQFMADKQGDSFEAFITGVHAYGFFVELEKFFVEGLVHVSSLTDDYYQYDERKHTLRGESKGRTFTLGNRVKVQLVRVDKERRRLDFHLEEGPLESNIKPLEVSAAEEKSEGASRRRRRRRRGRGKGGDKAAAAQQDSGKAGRGEQEADSGKGREAAKDRDAGKGSETKDRDAGKATDKDKGATSARQADQKDAAQESKKDAQKDTSKARDAKGDDKDSGGRRRRGGRRRGGRGKGGEAKDAKQAKEAKEAKGDERGDGKPRRQRRGARKSDDEGGRGRRSRGGRSSSTKPAERRANGDAGAQRSSTAKPATPDKVEAPKETPQDKPRPKVNPYLTDL